jgi:hypothetical protein
MKPPLGDRSLYSAENVPGSHQADFKSHKGNKYSAHVTDAKMLQVNAELAFTDVLLITRL